MRVLILDYKQYSLENIKKLENNFTKVYKINFPNINKLKIFLKNQKKNKKPVSVIFTSFGFYFINPNLKKDP